MEIEKKYDFFLKKKWKKSFMSQRDVGTSQ